MATRTWKLKENIKVDADGEIIRHYWRQQPKKFHRIMNVHENDARASSWAFSFFLSGSWTADVFSRA